MTRDEKLQKIGMSLPKSLVKKAMQQVDVHADQRKKMEGMRASLYKNSKLSSEQKRQADRGLVKMLENPKLYEKRGEMNKQAEKQIENYMEGRIKAKIHSGELPKPKMDSWMREKANKIQRHGW